jgi:hypothetical protein
MSNYGEKIFVTSQGLPNDLLSRDLQSNGANKIKFKANNVKQTVLKIILFCPFSCLCDFKIRAALVKHVTLHTISEVR